MAEDTPTPDAAPGKPPYRTVAVNVLMGVFMLLGALILRGSDAGDKMFGSLVIGLCGLGGVQGLRSAVEHAAEAWKAAQAARVDPK